MRQLATPLILAGFTLVLLGLFFGLGGNLSWLGRLPGDIRVTRPCFSFYFPITTSILISIIASLIIYLIRQLR